MNQRCLTLTLIAVLAILTAPAVAQAGYLISGNTSLPMVEQKVKVTIDNQVAVTHIEQTFENPGSAVTEAVYRFPLGEKATVQEFALTGPDGVRRIGSVEEKHEAETIYQNAQNAGVMPAIAQQADPNSFETKVGAVPAQGRAKIELIYTEILPYHSGKVQYGLPLNVSKLQTRTLTLNSVVIDLKDQKEVVKIDSPSHPINAVKQDDHRWSVVFEKSTWLPDSDFQLNYEVKAQRMGFNFLSTQPDEKESGYFLLLLAPQEVVDASDIAARDVVFVMDISGSMDGYKMEQTKTAFRFFVDQLNADDRFGIIAFDDSLRMWKDKIVPADRLNVADGKAFIDNLRATGGTDIDRALTRARELMPESQKSKVIIFLTDGEPTSGMTDINLIARRMKDGNTAQIRTFVFGVGGNVSSQLLDKIALENRGEAVYVHQNEDLNAKLTAFYDTISKPLLVDLGIDWGNIKVTECFPPQLPNVYKGSQVTVVGRYEKGGAAQITVKGMLNGALQKYPLDVNFLQKNSENRFVGRLWAKAKAEVLIGEMRAYGESSEKKAEVIRLSKAYQFTTPYTSFVSVAPEKVAVPANALDPYRQSQPQQNTWVQPQSAPAPAGNFLPIPPGPNSGQAAPKSVTVVHSTQAKSLNFWGAYGFFPAALAVPNFRKAREQAREKACYANMRVILGAVEMYNMDHPNLLTYVNDELITNPNYELVGGQYLKGQICKPEMGCSYYANGDLTGQGQVCCLLHGAVDDASVGAYGGNVTVQDNTPWNVKAWNAAAPMVELAINIPLLLLGLYLSYLIFIAPLIALLSAPFRWLSTPPDPSKH